MNKDIEVKYAKEFIEKNNLNLCIRENDTYIDIPTEILINLENEDFIIKDYIRIASDIKDLKDSINSYLFDENSSISANTIGNKIIKIKSEEKLDKILPYIGIDIHKLEERFKNLFPYFEISVEDINKQREEIKNNYVNNSYNTDNIIDKYYLEEIVNDIENSVMYSLKTKSRYGSISNEYKLKNKEEIHDFNDKEIGGQYCPILVIYRPAKYNRGVYVLDDTYHVYIKRQPLDSLIEQEKLGDKGIDGMGAFIYKKLKNNLSNANLQEIMAELFVYAQKNSLNFENIRLADITSNRIWLTADRLKQEFKELRYYHKNLTQKVKDIYDSTSAYYTQISGKYIFNTREFIHCYNTYKNKDINN